MLFWPRLKIDIFKTLVSLPYNYKHSFVWTVQFWMFKYVVERVKLNYFTILFMFKCGQILQQIHQYSILANLRFNPSCITSPINVMAYWMLKLFKYTFYRYSYRINKFWMFSVIKGSETDLQANEIQLVWMKTLILQTCSSIMWFQYHVRRKHDSTQHKKIFQSTTCKRSNFSRPSIKWYEPSSLLADVGL